MAAAPVWQRLRDKQGDFVAELRPAVPLFVRFGGLDFDGDESARDRLDELVRGAQHVVDGWGGTVGTAPLTSSGPSSATAVLRVTGLPGGPTGVSAGYGGDDGFAGSGDAATATVGFTRTTGNANGNVTVGAGEAVRITGTVGRSVTVSSGGAVEIDGRVNGGVVANGASEVVLCAARVGSSVSVSGGVVFVGGRSCLPSLLNGAGSFVNGQGGLEINSATVKGTLTVTGNTAASPGAWTSGGAVPVVTRTSVSGLLACSGHTPTLSDAGGPNTAGSRSGQCSGTF